MKVELINYTNNPILKIEHAASTCYDSNPSINGKIFNHCYKSGHHSVLEFADFTFKISGISRACANQIVRHRMASFTQRSQRYCLEDGFEYITPKCIEKTMSNEYRHLMDNIMELYSKMINTGIPTEDARMILPNACCTEICVKMNLRELIHFCNERLCMSAQWEIRELANKMKDLVVAIEPKMAEVLIPKCEKHKPFCFCTENKKRSCGRHKVIAEMLKE